VDSIELQFSFQYLKTHKTPKRTKLGLFTFLKPSFNPKNQKKIKPTGLGCF